MADKGKLMITDFGRDGKPICYNVQDCDYEFIKPVDSNYKPCADVKGGIINFTLLSDNEEDLNFHNWMLNIGEAHLGWFELPVTAGIARGGKPKTKAVQFVGAYCVRLSEYFSNNNAEQMHMRITIVAPIIQFSENTKFVNNAIDYTYIPLGI